MDLDPNGQRQVWNQPIEALLDVEYLDNQMDAHALESNLTSADLGPSNSLLVGEIARAEAELKSLALQSLVNQPSSALTQLRNQMLKEGYGESPIGSENLSQQVAELKALQQALIDNHEVTPTNNQVTKHRIFIKYASEAQFAQNHPESIKSDVRALDYVSVNGRSSWSPPTENLSQACQSGDVGTRVGKAGFGLVESNILNECGRLANHQIQDHPIATGAFPPKEIDVFHQAKADALNPKGLNTPGLTEKQKLYNHLRDIILNCDKGPGGAPSFDTVAKFLNDFDNTVRTNQITAADQARLLQEYSGARNFMDNARADESDPTVPSLEDDLAVHLQDMGVNANQVSGLSQLYTKLFPK